MNWALLREEAPVAKIKETSVAEKYDAALDELCREGKFKGEPPSIGLLTYMEISLARPYLKPGHRLIVPDSGPETEQALNEAVAAGRIRTNKNGLLRAEDVRREFPAKTGRDYGRGSRRHFNTEAIERLADYIRNNSRPPGELTALRDCECDNPDTLREKLQLPAMSKDSFVDAAQECRDRYRALLRRWNKFVPEYNAVVRPRNVGRPLEASEAQQAEVLKRHKRGESLRGIADEMNLGLRTVRTVIDRGDNRDRTTRKHLQRIDPDRAAAASWQARKRTRDALPRRINESLKTGRDLLKEAKGLGA